MCYIEVQQKRGGGPGPPSGYTPEWYQLTCSEYVVYNECIYSTIALFYVQQKANVFIGHETIHHNNILLAGSRQPHPLTSFSVLASIWC